MERREIGKYTVTIYDTLVADIKCEKARIEMRISVGENHILRTTNQEKDVTRILKMERISLKRDLAKIEKLLQY